MELSVILYVSKYGHCTRVAEQIYATLEEHGRIALRMNLEDYRPQSLSSYSEVIFVAPIYAGRYPRALRRFLRERANELRLLNTSLVSVSLTQATLEDPATSPGDLEDARGALESSLEDLLLDAHFRPSRVHHVAGALAYTRYGFVMRWLAKRVATHHGVSTDTTKDHDFTDWAALRTWAADRARDPDSLGVARSDLREYTSSGAI